MRVFFGLLAASFFGLFSLAQSPSAASPAPPVAAPIAYETATLPKDRVQPWELLRAATGLGDDTLQPWYLHASYKTYDAYGKPKGDGTMEYVWAGPKKWRESYTEGSTTWTRWQTEKGLVVPPGQPIQIDYPASLIRKEILSPILQGTTPLPPPTFFGNEDVLSSRLSCFRNVPETAPRIDEGPEYTNTSFRLCTAQGRPIPVLKESGSFTTFYQKHGVFQHRIVAKQIVIRADRDPVIDIDVDALHTLDQNNLVSLDAPKDAIEQSCCTDLEHRPAFNRDFLKRFPYRHPDYLNAKQIEGVVVLSIVIHKDGTVTIQKVLHSQDPALTRAAEEYYERGPIFLPPVKDGKPVEFYTQVNWSYRIGR